VAAVISGTWQIGYGTIFDEKKLKALVPGVFTPSRFCNAISLHTAEFLSAHEQFVRCRHVGELSGRNVIRVGKRHRQPLE
jgi:hypothetical protein